MRSLSSEVFPKSAFTVMERALVSVLAMEFPRSNRQCHRRDPGHHLLHTAGGRCLRWAESLASNCTRAHPPPQPRTLCSNHRGERGSRGLASPQRRPSGSSLWACSGRWRSPVCSPSIVNYPLWPKRPSKFSEQWWLTVSLYLQVPIHVLPLSQSQTRFQLFTFHNKSFKYWRHSRWI